MQSNSVQSPQAAVAEVLHLPAAPCCPEEALNAGCSLVLGYSIWNVPDRTAIATAASLARRFAGRVRVAVRPFDFREETKVWRPEWSGGWGSPVWLVLRDGALAEELVGLQDEEAIADAVSRVIAKSPAA
jgi:hypothetical protein